MVGGISFELPEEPLSESELKDGLLRKNLPGMLSWMVGYCLSRNHKLCQLGTGIAMGVV